MNQSNEKYVYNNGKLIYHEDSKGNWDSSTYDKNGNLIRTCGGFYGKLNFKSTGVVNNE